MTDERTLLEAVYAAVADRTPLADATVDRVTVGDRLVLVAVVVDGDDANRGGERAAGVSHRPPGSFSDDVSGESALAVAGRACSLTDGENGYDDGHDAYEGSRELRRAVGVATLNALSAPIIEWRTGDPFEALSEDVSVIATVGLFGPAFRKFGAVEVRVIEQRAVTPPETPADVSVELFGPDEAASAMEGADVVFVTGSSLLYGGTEDYLAVARGIPSVVLVGATASFVPGPAFEAGATMVAGARVTDAEAVRRGAVAGDCATDLHDEGLEKVFVMAGGTPGSGFDLR